jgi:hypothetical protein
VAAEKTSLVNGISSGSTTFLLAPRPGSFPFQDTPHYKIDTNNYVESWHHHLKTFYLKLMRKQRIDVLLHILTEQVEPDFRRSDIRVALDFERPRLSKSEQVSYQKARLIPSEDLDDMIDYADIEDNTASKVIPLFFYENYH